MRRPTRITQDIVVRHNIEVAHRLFELPGKCEQIHGHSMWVKLWIEGDLNEHGILNGIEFGALKSTFRGYLDTEYDHRVLINGNDPFASSVQIQGDKSQGTLTQWLKLPGLQICSGDPTTENIAKWIAEGMKERIGSKQMDDVKSLMVEVWETSVNGASYYEEYDG